MAGEATQAGLVDGDALVAQPRRQLGLADDGDARERPPAGPAHGVQHEPAGVGGLERRAPEVPVVPERHHPPGAEAPRGHDGQAGAVAGVADDHRLGAAVRAQRPRHAGRGNAGDAGEQLGRRRGGGGGGGGRQCGGEGEREDPCQAAREGQGTGVGSDAVVDDGRGDGDGGDAPPRKGLAGEAVRHGGDPPGWAGVPMCGRNPAIRPLPRQPPRPRAEARRGG